MKANSPGYYGTLKNGKPRLSPKYCWQDLGEEEYDLFTYFDEHGSTCDKEDEWYHRIVYNRYQKALFLEEREFNGGKLMVWIWPVSEFQRSCGKWVDKSDLILRNPYRRNRKRQKKAR
jgi:hypothetical protein